MIDGPDGGDDGTLRPNQVIAAAVPDGPLDAAAIDRVVAAMVPLLTPIGLRSLPPDDPRYRPFHRGDGAARDGAYHQGTVWPWLVGPYVEASLAAGRVDAALACIDALDVHLGDFGLGSVSETADGAAPHRGTGCPFQAWSVAELIRACRLARLRSSVGVDVGTTHRGNAR